MLVNGVSPVRTYKENINGRRKPEMLPAYLEDNQPERVDVRLGGGRTIFPAILLRHQEFGSRERRRPTLY